MISMPDTSRDVCACIKKIFFRNQLPLSYTVMCPCSSGICRRICEFLLSMEITRCSRTENVLGDTQEICPVIQASREVDQLHVL